MITKEPRRNALPWVLVPVAVGAMAYRAFPSMLRRSFAPPQRDASAQPSDVGLESESVALTSQSGASLHGWFIPVDRAAPAVVVLHGWGGNAALMLPLAPHLHEAGFHALFLDARNHGRSEHDSFTSMPRFAEDLDVGIEWLGQQAAVTSIGVIGHSVGAGAAILTASNGAPIAAVVSVSSLAHPEATMRGHLGRLPGPALEVVLRSIQKMIGHEFDDFAPVERIADVPTASMLVHGDADELVPVEDLHRLSAARPDAEVVVVNGAGHSDLEAFEPHVGEIMAFLSRHLAP